ncbi:MAG: RlmE family RNA methyltransferase [Desulfovibrionaceae bacterium]
MKQYRDHYFKKAKQDNYPARSVYKLQEIESRFKIFRKGQTVLDLGAAPGSWTLWASRKVGEGGRVLGIDLQDTATAFEPNTTFLVADAFEEGPELLAAMEPLAPFDLVLSDMAPRTTGVKFADQARSLELCERALEVACARLKPGGHFVVKIFEGPDVKGYTDALRPLFGKVKTFKPKSSRAESKEMFIVGLGFRPADG